MPHNVRAGALNAASVLAPAEASPNGSRKLESGISPLSSSGSGDGKSVMSRALGSDENYSAIAKHGLIMLVFGNVYTATNYVYQVSMGILLTPEDYGILFSLTSLFMIFMVFSHGMVLASAKFTSEYVAKGQGNSIYTLWRWMLKRTAWLGVLAGVLFLALSPVVVGFLNLNAMFYPLILFASLPFAFAISINWGVMQGMQRFASFGLNQAFLGIIRVALAIALVLLGWGLFGSLIAVPIAWMTAFFLSFLGLDRLFRRRSYPSVDTPLRVEGFVRLTMASVLALLGITVLTNIDVIVVNHYLGSAQAGEYSKIAVLGRIAFFAPVAVIGAMVPKTSALFENGGDHFRLFVRTAGIVAVISVGIVAGFALFPEMIVHMVFGAQSNSLVSALVFPYGLAMALLSFSCLGLFFLLSLNQLRAAYSVMGVVIVQLILMGFFHSNLIQFINVMLATSLLSVAVILPFCLRVRKRKMAS
ncbi:MAG: oligosaccharide flippase family protein [Dehalococcoidia bacterium]|nr:oligosaccharide flippase family protein [Dehalococcoidia bacterium]